MLNDELNSSISVLNSKIKTLTDNLSDALKDNEDLEK